MMVAWNLSERMATASVAAVRTLIEEDIGEKTRDELWEKR